MISVEYVRQRKRKRTQKTYLIQVRKIIKIILFCWFKAKIKSDNSQ